MKNFCLDKLVSEKFFGLTYMVSLYEIHDSTTLVEYYIGVH